jgi:hypothetical protein
MKELTVNLTDSDGNSIMALVEYNEMYPVDNRVLSAVVYTHGDWIAIINTGMVHAQYREEILKCITAANSR